MSTRLATFSASDIEGLRPAMKIGILATVNAQGLPHLTLLSSLKASSATTVTFGQFTEGLSKVNVTENPRAGFLAMTLQRELWRGTATFSHTEKSGPDYDAYNDEPMFRYNAYFGIHTVYSLELVEHAGRESLPMGRIVAATLATVAAGAAIAAGGKEPRPGRFKALNPWTRGLMSAMGNLKFAGYVGPDGYPRIVPVLQARAVGGDRIVFSLAAYGAEIAAIPAGAPIAVFGMTLSMEDVLLRGTYVGVKRICGLRCGVAKIDWVYNPMPPVPGQIYPAIELSPVATFDMPGRV
jgi:hypothetical protein